MKIWENDRKSGQEESASGCASNSVGAAYPVRQRSIWRSTASYPRDTNTTDSPVTAELHSTADNSVLEMCSYYVLHVMKSRRDEITSRVKTRGWRWSENQQTILFDEYDQSIAEIYESGLMCQLCRFALFHLDIECPSDDRKGGERE